MWKANLNHICRTFTANFRTFRYLVPRLSYSLVFRDNRQTSLVGLAVVANSCSGNNLAMRAISRGTGTKSPLSWTRLRRRPTILNITIIK